MNNPTIEFELKDGEILPVIKQTDPLRSLFQQFSKDIDEQLKQQ